MQQRFSLLQPVDNRVHALGHRGEKIRDSREHVAAGKAFDLAHDKSRRLVRDLHRDPPDGERRREQPSRGARIEQANHLRGCLQELERMRRGRSVHDFELEGVLSDGDRRAAGARRKPRSRQTRRSGFCRTDCRRFSCESRGSVTKRWMIASHSPETSSIIAESWRCASSPAAASCRAPIRVGSPPSCASPSASRSRSDGSTVITAVLRFAGCARQRERSGNRGLTDAASPEQNRNRAFGEQVFQESAPSEATDSSPANHFLVLQEIFA